MANRVIDLMSALTRQKFERRMKVFASFDKNQREDIYLRNCKISSFRELIVDIPISPRNSRLSKPKIRAIAAKEVYSLKVHKSI